MLSTHNGRQRPGGARGNRAGVALLIAMLTMAIAFALVIGFMELATTDITIAENQLSFVQATCAADAGIEDAIARLEANWGWSPPTTPVVISTDPPASYTLNLVRVAPQFADVSALGECRGVRARVSAKLRRFATRREMSVFSWTDRETLASP
jgi:hypothetical protein